jgi:hypothetical protein
MEFVLVFKKDEKCGICFSFDVLYVYFHFKTHSKLGYYQCYEKKQWWRYLVVTSNICMPRC